VSQRHQIGEFEHLALSAILHLGDQAYALPIRQKIEQLGRRKVSRGALYTTLMRLEEKGYLASSVGDPMPQRGGRARRYFTVSDEGLAMLRASRERLMNFWRGLEDYLETGG